MTYYAVRPTDRESSHVVTVHREIPERTYHRNWVWDRDNAPLMRAHAHLFKGLEPGECIEVEIDIRTGPLQTVVAGA